MADAEGYRRREQLQRQKRPNAVEQCLNKTGHINALANCKPHTSYLLT